MTNGLFIALEGIEGSGKSTQADRLSQRFRGNGRNSILTKEPGGTPLGDRIRGILLDPSEDGMDPLTELFLYSASRRQHVVDIIRPSLERGIIVVCDRFTDATLAYQGFGRSLDLQQLRQLNALATGDLHPDVTIIFDLAEDIGLERARARNQDRDLHRESRLEGEDLRFHRKVREGYLALAEADPARYAVIDATGSIEDVFQRMTDELARRFPELELEGA